MLAASISEFDPDRTWAGSQSGDFDEAQTGSDSGQM
jgi:hypothetical protein